MRWRQTMSARALACWHEQTVRMKFGRMLGRSAEGKSEMSMLKLGWDKLRFARVNGNIAKSMASRTYSGWRSKALTTAWRLLRLANGKRRRASQMLVKLAMPFSRHAAFLLFIDGLRRASRAGRRAAKAVRAWRVNLRQAWGALRKAAAARALTRIRMALSRGHMRGRTMHGSFLAWAQKVRGTQMRRRLSIAASAVQQAADLAYALGRFSLNRRMAITDRNNLIRGHNHRVVALWRFGMSVWREMIGVAHKRCSIAYTGVAYKLSSGARRAFLALAIHAHSRLSFIRAERALKRRKRRTALLEWKRAINAYKALQSFNGGAGQHGRMASRRRGFTALRANAREARIAKIIANSCASGREQLKRMSLVHACGRLRTNAAARKEASQRMLVASQAGLSKRAAALLQPLRTLWTISALRALQRWRDLVVVCALDQRVMHLQAVLEAELELKRRHSQQLQPAASKPKPKPPPPPPTPQYAVRAPVAPYYGGGHRSALDKLFAVLEMWEAGKVRPVLWEWRRAALAQPSSRASYSQPGPSSGLVGGLSARRYNQPL